MKFCPLACTSPSGSIGPLSFSLRDRSAARDLRQQRRERLGLRLERGQPRRLGLFQLRIVLQSALIDREQVRRRRDARDQTCGEHEK